MDLQKAVGRLFEGEPMYMLARAYREGLIDAMELGEDDVTQSTFRAETKVFMNQLCRHLGDRHADDHRVCIALREWVHRVDDYEAYDALLTSFRFDDRTAVLRKGRILFPGPLTAHWQT